MPTRRRTLQTRVEEFYDRCQHARQVLLVAIQVGEDVSRRAAPTAIDGVVLDHIFFHEGLHTPVRQEPVQRAVVRAGVLDDVRHRQPLVGHRSHTWAQPARTGKTGSAYRELHRRSEWEGRRGRQAALELRDGAEVELRTIVTTIIASPGPV